MFVMGNFNRGNSYNRDNRSDSNRETFQAQCADCGKDCDLPFKPSGSRPVYCRDCFKKHSPEDSRGRSSDRGGDRFSKDRFSRNTSSRGDRELFDAVCAKCGNDCKVPFKPTPGKDTLCSRCFEDKGGDSRSVTNGSAKHLDEINAKLDKILEMLNSQPGKSKKAEKVSAPVEEVAVIEAVAEVTEEPKVKKTKAKKTSTKKA
jgi:CxxC-x17-CxxC domain-containing protein